MGVKPTLHHGLQWCDKKSGSWSTWNWTPGEKKKEWPLLVALNHETLQWARFLWVPPHPLCTHWCHRPHFGQARTRQGLSPSGFRCRSFCWASAAHRQRLAEPPNLPEAKVMNIRHRSIESGYKVLWITQMNGCMNYFKYELCYLTKCSLWVTVRPSLCSF